MHHITYLNNHIIGKIYSFLSIKDICAARITCTYFKSIKAYISSFTFTDCDEWNVEKRNCEIQFFSTLHMGGIKQLEITNSMYTIILNKYVFKNLKMLILNNCVMDKNLFDCVKINRSIRIFAMLDCSFINCFGEIMGLNTITSLNLWKISMTLENFKSVSQMSNLTSLMLANMGLSDRSTKYISNMHNVTTLSISYSTFTNIGFANISSMTNLTSLDVSDTRIDDKDIACVSKMRKLVQLNISGTMICDEGLKYIVDLPMLMSLNLSDTVVGNNGIKIISKMISLVTLKVNCTYVGDECVQYLCEMKNLCDFYALDTLITDVGFGVVGGFGGVRVFRWG